MEIIPAVMSGGAGSRLWPVSTAALPKQFHRLLSDKPMIVETVERFRGASDVCSFLPPIVVAGAGHRDIIAGQFAEAGVRPLATILEPVGRNTAAAAAAAALMAQEKAPGAKVLLLPSDHVIADPAAFRAAIGLACEHLKQSIITFGISPSEPETGLGYIRRGEALGDGVFEIASFTEKPDRATAEQFLASGEYSWNSGMFLFAPEVLLAEFEVHQPEMLALVRAALAAADVDGDEVLLDAGAFGRISAQPLDVAIMERTSRGAVIPCSIGWADVGCWSEYWRLSGKDALGNATRGTVTLSDVSNALVHSGDGVRVSVCGLSDVVVIATGDSVLVLPRSRAQEVRELVAGA